MSSEIDSIRRRLEAGKGVRRRLPGDVRLHIDRLLPFLCVYRRPPRTADRDTERLITSQAAYLIATDPRGATDTLRPLIRTIAEVAKAEFGDFLLIEVWTSPPVETALDQPAEAGFRIHAPDPEALATTLSALRDGLGPIRIGKRPAIVDTPRRTASQPRGLKSIAPDGIRWLGIEVAPSWRRDETSFPIILQKLRRGFSKALKRACFRFTRDHTEHRPRHFHALGRRAWVKSASDVDAELASIAESFDFLLLMTPTNPDAAYTRFREGRFRKRPTFLYRHLPIDPVRVKRELYAARIERVEDPTLADLFRHVQRDLDLRLSALLERHTSRALLICRQIYGDVEPALLAEAEGILETIPARAREREGKRTVGATEFASEAQAEIERYREQDPTFDASVTIRDDIAGLMVSRGQLLVAKRMQVAASRVPALLQHEVGTHVVTYRNGAAQPLHQLRFGLPGYEELQEGLAVLAEYLCGELSRPRLRLLAARVVAAHSLIAGATFVETYDLLHSRWKFPTQVAFGITMRVHRGGGMPKDAAYLRGLRAMVDYVGGGGEFEPLLVGKIAFDHLPLVRELRFRQVLVAPVIRPQFLNFDRTAERIGRLRPGLPLIALTQKEVT